jgi:chromosome segregation ATPase
MALRALSERGEKFHQRLEAFAGQIEETERAIREKTSQTHREADDIRAQIDSLSAAVEERVMQGRRESEDIRTQIAPLLEAHGQKPDTHEQLLSEFDRLRSSLAESLSDLSERLRNAVRGM